MFSDLKEVDLTQREDSKLMGLYTPRNVKLKNTKSSLKGFYKFMDSRYIMDCK